MPRRGSNYDYDGLSNHPHSQSFNSGFQSASSEGRYLQSGSNPYTDYLHPELSMQNPVGGMRGHTMFGVHDNVRTVGGKFSFKKAAKSVGKTVGKTATDVGKAVATQAATDAIIGALTNPAVDEALLEGAEVGAMALGRRRGRPPLGSNPATYTPKYLSQAGGKIHMKKVGRTLGKAVKSVGKAAAPIVTKAAQKQLEKGMESMIENMMAEEAAAAGLGEFTGGKRRSFSKALKSVVKHPITKKIASEVYDVAMPIIKEQGKAMVKEGMNALISSLSEGEAVGGKKRHIGKTLGRIGKSVAKVAAPIAVGALTTATGNPELAPVTTAATAAAMKGLGAGGYYHRGDLLRRSIDDMELLGDVVKKQAKELKAKRGGAMSGGRARRAAIVKRVMAERGVTLPHASKIVKEEGLY